jgi:hypothetical protein
MREGMLDPEALALAPYSPIKPTLKDAWQAAREKGL